MIISDIRKLVDDLAQTLVVIEWSNVPADADLAARFADLAAALRESGYEDGADQCGRAAGIARRLQDGECGLDGGADYLARTLDALQACLDGDCSCAAADWPAIETAAPSPAVDAESGGVINAEASALVDDAIMSEFLARQADILDDVEKELLSVEAGESPGDHEGINRFFHTLKGESALLGLTDVAELCHAAEDMMQARGLAGCVDQLLEVKDWFITTFGHLSQEGPAPTPLAEMLTLLRGASDSGPDSGAENEAPTAPAASAGEYEVVPYTHINVLAGDLDLVRDFVEEALEHLDAAEALLLALERDRKDNEALNAVFRGFHTIKGLAGFIEMEHIKDLAHKAENLLDMARRDELDLVGVNMDLVFESVDLMKRLIEGVVAAMGGDGTLAAESDLPSLMARLVAATTGEEAPVAEPAPAPEPPPEVAKETKPTAGFIPLNKMKKKSPSSAVAEAPAASAPAVTKTNGPAKMKEAMRVDAERLDHLIETIGELIIAESMVSQSPEIQQACTSVKLAKDLDHLDKICRELQEIGMSLRMIPVRPVFQKMARLVRDLSKKQNRQVEFVMTGEDTELDKNVVDKIGDPLVHMVRNAMDHGIEADPADRIKLGKPKKGRVELRAFHKGGNICIEIADDGRGLNREAIAAKAVSRGLLREGEVVTDRELFNLILEPGFSTAKQVTDISGRGVGMDVVRRNIEELRGTVDITSELGQGTTFSIRLPLTLAIIEGMVVVVGREHYIIPTLSVVRLIRPTSGDITHVFDKGELLTFEDDQLPLFRLSQLFEVEGATTEPHEAMVVVVEDEGRKIGLLADRLLGQQSIVIKSLGASVQDVDGIAGGAIMSDGNVALILDVAGLTRVAHVTDTTVRSADAKTERANVAATVDASVAKVEASEITATESNVTTQEPEFSPVGVDV